MDLLSALARKGICEGIFFILIGTGGPLLLLPPGALQPLIVGPYQPLDDATPALGVRVLLQRRLG